MFQEKSLNVNSLLPDPDAKKDLYCQNSKIIVKDEI
jgi:hypothetical protein